MKSFCFDTILDRENICNLTNERELLLKGVFNKSKLIVYGPRNFGKTSVVKSIIIPEFRKKYEKSFILFADLMQVRDIESIHERIKIAFEHAFRDSLPKKHLLENAKKFLLDLRPQLNVDPHTGEPSLTITSGSQTTKITFMEIFDTIYEKIAPYMPTLIVLDEFQDIALIQEAEDLMRGVLQRAKYVSIILMGSKRHLFSNIVASPDLPLTSFGENIDFQPIPYEEYHEYISERFVDRKLNISLDLATKLQDLLFRIPESINIVCAFLFEHYQNKTISEIDIVSAIEEVVERRRSRNEEYLSHFSEKEEQVLISIAKSGPVKYPTGKEFIKTVNVTSRAVSQIIKKFLDRSVIELIDEGYRVTDPLLYCFLRRFR